MKRIGCLCLAAAVLLSVTACGGSASSVSSSVPEVSSSSAETAEVSAADFYDAFDEIIQDGEYGMHAKGITDNAKKFIADHDELFSQNKPLSGDDLGLLQENMDLRSVIKNQEKAGNALFNETGMVAMIQEHSLGEDEEFTMGIIDCYNQPVGGQYCVFAYKGTVDALAGDDVSFTALPLCAGEVEQADGSTRTCVYSLYWLYQYGKAGCRGEQWNLCFYGKPECCIGKQRECYGYPGSVPVRLAGFFLWPDHLWRSGGLPFGE